MYPCPCCGYLVFEGVPGSYALCPICYWEDDAVQLLDPGYSGGANTPSLKDSQENFRRFGAMEERFVRNVRPPLPTEHRDPLWRPVQEADLDRIKRPADLAEDEWCSDVVYYWRRSAS